MFRTDSDIIFTYLTITTGSVFHNSVILGSMWHFPSNVGEVSESRLVIIVIIVYLYIFIYLSLPGKSGRQVLLTHTHTHTQTHAHIDTHKQTHRKLAITSATIQSQFNLPFCVKFNNSYKQPIFYFNLSSLFTLVVLFLRK